MNYIGRSQRYLYKKLYYNQNVIKVMDIIKTNRYLQAFATRLHKFYHYYKINVWSWFFRLTVLVPLYLPTEEYFHPHVLGSSTKYDDTIYIDFMEINLLTKHYYKPW